jgi:hypothetical protein
MPAPNIFSVVVAILAGIVCVVSLTESRVNALQLRLNVVLLILVGAGGLSTQRGMWRVLDARQRTRGRGR